MQTGNYLGFYNQIIHNEPVNIPPDHAI